MKKPAVPNFIEIERAKGKSDEEIKSKLLDAGWHMDIVLSAMKGGIGRKVIQETKPAKATSYREIILNKIKTPFFGSFILLLLVLLAIFI